MPTESEINLRNASLNVIIKPHDPLVSDEALVIFQYICYTSVNTIIGVCGVVTNIINIICFIKQGFGDSFNVSLLGLGISDLGSLVTSLYLNMFMTPAFIQADLPFEPMDTQYLTASFPHVLCARISSYITAFITLERCLCIAMPLKVKLIFTTKRVAAIIACGIIIPFLIIIHFYFVNIYTRVFFPDRNRTIMAIVRTKNHKIVEQFAFTINIVVEFGIYICVIACTFILTSQLQSKRKWRQSVVPGNSDNLSSRDQKVAQMTVIISTIFIICFIPNCAMSIGMAIEKDLSIKGKYKNTLVVLFGVGVLLESVNSAINIVIYYKVSSRYRLTFRHIFGYQKDRQKTITLITISKPFTTHSNVSVDTS